MKIQKKTFLYIISISLAIAFSTFIWKFIKLPYQDNGMVGNYSLNSYNGLNDVLRYILFISLPILAYLSLKFFYENNSLTEIGLVIKTDYINYPKIGKSQIFLFIFLISLLILEFLSLEFPEGKIDSYHDGQRLSSAYKSLLDGSLWSGSYVTVGIFYETISSKLMWKLFNNESIGLSRIADIIYIFIFKLLLINFSLLISQFIRVNIIYKNIFFLFNSLVFINLFNYNIRSIDLITFREIPIILISIFFMIFLLYKNYQNFSLIVIGSLSVLTLFWGVDRGLVLNLLILVISFYLILLNDYKKLIVLISSIFIFWALFYFLLGDEFNHFIINTLSVYKEMNYLHGIIHPAPFSEDPNSYRASKTLILIIFCLLISLSLFFKSSKEYSSQLKIILLFFSIISFFSYIYALSRSDGPHIKHIFGYPLMFFSIYLSYLLIQFLSNRIKNIPKFINYFFLILFFGFLSFKILDIKFEKIKNYNDRFQVYSYLPDEHFLREDEAIFVNKAKKIVNKYDCIQLVTNDAVFLYLLKKKSCTKYYFVWSAGSIEKQKELIANLDKNKIIIANGPKDNWDIPLSKKLFLVKEYIDANFYKQQTIEKWDILIAK